MTGHEEALEHVRRRVNTLHHATTVDDPRMAFSRAHAAVDRIARHYYVTGEFRHEDAVQGAALFVSFVRAVGDAENVSFTSGDAAA